MDPYCSKVPMGMLIVYVISCGHQDEILEVDKYHWLGWRGLLPVLRSYQDSSLYCLGDGYVLCECVSFFMVVRTMCHGKKKNNVQRCEICVNVQSVHVKVMC